MAHWLAGQEKSSRYKSSVEGLAKIVDSWSLNLFDANVFFPKKGYRDFCGMILDASDYSELSVEDARDGNRYTKDLIELSLTYPVMVTPGVLREVLTSKDNISKKIKKLNWKLRRAKNHIDRTSFENRQLIGREVSDYGNYLNELARILKHRRVKPDEFGICESIIEGFCDAYRRGRVVIKGKLRAVRRRAPLKELETSESDVDARLVSYAVGHSISRRNPVKLVSNDAGDMVYFMNFFVSYYEEFFSKKLGRNFDVRSALRKNPVRVFIFRPDEAAIEAYSSTRIGELR